MKRLPLFTYTHPTPDWVFHLTIDEDVYEVTVTRGRKRIFKVSQTDTQTAERKRRFL